MTPAYPIGIVVIPAKVAIQGGQPICIPTPAEPVHPDLIEAPG